MLDSRLVTELAEAVADGRTPDWASAESSASDAVERGVIAELRALQGIHGLMMTCTVQRTGDDARTVLGPGDTWGGLEIRAHVGRGRFGDVYRAWDPALDREVALKLIVHGDHEDAVETRVVAEGRLMARVRHPNVVTILGAQRIAGVSGLWMEFVEGRTLAAEVGERGPFDADELVQVGAELARALDAVHRAGLVHRDVKAQNVLREAGGRVVLGDFGTGLELDEPDEARGGLAGTPAYLAPEIFARAPATPQSDLYSLGALLFHLATGQHAVPGRSLRDLRDAHARGTRQSMEALRPDLPGPIRQAIDRALDPDPERRFESGAAMAAALEACAVSSRPEPRRGGVAVAAAVLTAFVGLGVYALARPDSLEVVAPPTIQQAQRVVLVTAVENRTGEPLLDGTLEFALARELAGSAAFGVASHSRVQETLALMRRPADTPLDPSVARELALRDGEIVALVTGRVEKVGDAYALGLEARAPADGTLLASVVSPPVRNGAILETVGRLALDLRGQLGTSVRLPDPPSPRLPRVTTSSLRALQLYTEARRLENDEGLLLGREPEAEHLLRVAITEDPEFAAAHLRLGIVVRLEAERRGESRLEEALAHTERAIALSPILTPIERLKNEGQRHFIKFLMRFPEPENSVHARALIANCEALLQLDPDDPDTLIACVIVSDLTGTPNPRVTTRLAELRPASALWQLAAARAILAAEPADVARARPFIQRAARLAPHAAQAHHVARARQFEAHEAWVSGLPGQAFRVAEQLRSEMQTLPADARARFAESLWPLYVDLGQLDRAEQVLSEITTWPNRRNAQVIVATFREDRTALRAVLQRSFPKTEEAGGVASAYLEAGMVDESRRLIQAQRQLAAQGREPQTRAPGFSQYLVMLEGNLALLEERPHDAVVLFQRFLDNHGSRQRGSRDRRVRRLLADALAATGDLGGAVAVLESASDRPLATMGWPLNGQAEWLQIRERLAALYRRLGRDREAEAVEHELRTLLALADENHPIKRRLTAAIAATR